jgi:hypothetical protein
MRKDDAEATAQPSPSYSRNGGTGANSASLWRTKYLAYMQSEEWREVRQRWLVSSYPKICYACDASWKLGFHLHHRTYKRLGAEYLRDLILLCPDCHRRTHQEIGSLWGNARRIRRANGIRGPWTEEAAIRRTQVSA